MKESNKNSEIESEDKEIDELRKIDPFLLFPETIAYPSQIIQQNSDSKYNINNNNIEMNVEPTKYEFIKDESIQKKEINKAIVYDLKIYSNLLVCISQGIIKVFSLDTLEEIQYYELKDEVLYTLSLTEYDNDPICACGGVSLVIRIINFNTQKEMMQLIGHKNEVYDLKFHPKESHLLLSASKDTSIRLWNITTQAQICIFGGPLGHQAEVLSISWHLSGEYFVSSGIDNCIKIWKIVPKIQQKIEESKYVKPYIITPEMFDEEKTDKNEMSINNENSMDNDNINESENQSENDNKSKIESKDLNSNNQENNYQENNYQENNNQENNNQENNDENIYNNMLDKSDKDLKSEHQSENMENFSEIKDDKNDNELDQKRFKTLIKTKPFYSCNTVHDNYIDCVEFNGNFIISKSVDGVIKEWLPIFNREGDSYYLINSYTYNAREKIWYVKFYFDAEINHLFVGNEKGLVYLFHLKTEDENEVNELTNHDDVLDTQTYNIIRAIAYSKDYNICAIACNTGEVILSKLKIV